MTVQRQKWRREQGALCRGDLLLALIVVAGAFLSGCDLFGEENQTQEPINPAYVDENENGVNDYIEASSHEAGTSETARTAASDSMPMGPAPRGHAFVDNNDDGICDYAQNGSSTWHGPNFVDEDGNGRCDYWEPGGWGHGHHGGHNGHHGGGG